MRTLALRMLRPAGLAALLISVFPVHAEGVDDMFHQLMDEAGIRARIETHLQSPGPRRLRPVPDDMTGDAEVRVSESSERSG